MNRWVDKITDKGVFDREALEKHKYRLIFNRAAELYLKLELMERHTSKKGERIKHIMRVCQSKMK